MVGITSVVNKNNITGWTNPVADTFSGSKNVNWAVLQVHICLRNVTLWDVRNIPLSVVNTNPLQKHENHINILLV